MTITDSQTLAALRNELAEVRSLRGMARRMGSPTVLAYEQRERMLRLRIEGLLEALRSRRNADPGGAR